MATLKSRRYAPRKPRRERSVRVTIASLSVLAVAAIGLSGLALFSSNDSDGASNGRVDAASARPSDEASPAGDDDGATPGSVVRSERLIAVSDDPDRLVRAEGTDCGAGAVVVETSADGGATWSDADTSLLDVAGVRQVQFGQAGRVQLAYVDEQCTLHTARSYVYGDAWESGSGSGGVWTQTADIQSGTIVAGDEEVEAPCTVVDVAGGGENGMVLCETSTVSVTVDGGDTWSQEVVVPGAQAVTADGDDSYIVLSLNADGCEGVSTRQFTDDSLADAGECVIGDTDPKRVAVSAGADVVYAWVSEEILLSTDAGQTWD